MHFRAYVEQLGVIREFKLRVIRQTTNAMQAKKHFTVSGNKE